MSSFNANLQIFNVMTENELAKVLSHYNSEFIFSVVDLAMKARFQNVPIAGLPNVVGAWEQNFKAIISQYGSESVELVNQVRNDTYDEIINMICKEFGLNFTIDDSIDKYSAAFHLYNLFVCCFMDNMITFFANYIYKERANIYESLELSELKKNKDTSTIYGKKMYKDMKLAIINANIDMVVREISATDIPFQAIISLICGNNSELKKYYLTIVSAESDFFSKVYVPVLRSDIRSEILTSIRFKLLEIATAHDQANTTEDMTNN